MSKRKANLNLSKIFLRLFQLGIGILYPTILMATIGISNNQLITSKHQSLSFQDRIKCMASIEKIYYSHRIWNNPLPKPSFEEAVPIKIIEEKAEDILKKSNALEYFWKSPITAEQLQAEIERISKFTKNPSVLKEIFEVFNNNAYLIAECLARPILVDRFIRNFYAYDERFHNKIKEKALKDLEMYQLPEFMKKMAGEYSEIEIIKEDNINYRNQLPHKNQLILSKWDWDEYLKEQEIEALEINKISELKENENSFYVRAILEKSDGIIKIAQVIWQKIEFEKWWIENRDNFSIDTKESFYNYELPLIRISEENQSDNWEPMISCVKKRYNHTAVWTGGEMIIWGGWVSEGKTKEGIIYNPATDSWRCMSTTNAPSPRDGHIAIWANRSKDINVMIIWGGSSINAAYENTGSWYDPLTDSWKTMKTEGSPLPRTNHTAVWTGREMLIWGGNVECNNPPWCDVGCTDTGALYDPAFEDKHIIPAWRAIPISPLSSARTGHTAVWTGDSMIIWGGSGCMDPPNCEWLSEYLISGGIFHYHNKKWTKVNEINAPSERKGHAAVWSPITNEMIVWGGYKTNPQYDICPQIGGKYNPLKEQWIATSAFRGRRNFTALWAEDKMIVWGGYGTSYSGDGCYAYLNDGGIYYPNSDSWQLIPSTSILSPRNRHTAVWTDTEMIIFGGIGSSGLLNSGARYNPATFIWYPINIGQPEGRYEHTAIWTGIEMIIWGGKTSLGKTNTGAKYNPTIDRWQEISNLNAPEPRYWHSSIFSGIEMIIWGGYTGNTNLNTGGRYNVNTDSWTSTSTLNAPSARRFHKAVWTGNKMIVWGGLDTSYTNSGYKYYPNSNLWEPISSANAPTGRIFFNATWANTSNEMIIWGGRDISNAPVNTGGKYNIATNSWQPTSTIGAPEAREKFTIVWTGDKMIVWGGYNGTSDIKSGGIYNPIIDSWISTVIDLNTPQERQDHTAIFTGNHMIIWGGRTCLDPPLCGSYIDLDTGAKYDPINDMWLPISLINAPSKRSFHTTVWAPEINKMLIWGGGNYLYTGSKYTP